MNRFLGFGREYNYSFISEIMLMNKTIGREIVSILNNIDDFYKICTINLDGDTYNIADYEVYGNFVYKFYPEMYNLKTIKTRLMGKYCSGWISDEILTLIKELSEQDFDMFTYHTWI